MLNLQILLLFQILDDYDNNDVELYLDSNSRSSGELADTELETNQRRYSRHFTLSPETTDYDSNCGDLDSLSNDMNGCGGGIGSGIGTIGGINSSGIIPDYGRLYTSMPVLEDGLSSGHASDTENNNSTSNHKTPNATTINNNTNATDNILDDKYVNNNINNKTLAMHSTSTTAGVNNTTTTMQSVKPNVEYENKTNASTLSNTTTGIGLIDGTKLDNFSIGVLGLQYQQQLQSQQQLSHQQQQSQPYPQQFSQSQSQSQSQTYQSQQQQAQQQNYPKNEDNRIDSKSYLDSDINSIFSNSKYIYI